MEFFPAFNGGKIALLLQLEQHLLMVHGDLATGKKQHDLENPLSLSSLDTIYLLYHVVSNALMEHLYFSDIPVNRKYHQHSHLRRTMGGGVLDRQVLLSLFCPPFTAKPQSASFYLALPGSPCCASCPGCNRYGLWLYIAQMN